MSLRRNPDFLVKEHATPLSCWVTLAGANKKWGDSDRSRPIYLFLEQAGGTPELSEADYMAGTIRSGLDWFFAMAQTGSVLTGLKLQRGFGQEMPRSFPELKASYDSTFQQLRESSHSAKAIGLLLSLIQMMLIFMTVYFPSFLSFSNVSDGSTGTDLISGYRVTRPNRTVVFFRRGWRGLRTTALVRTERRRLLRAAFIRQRKYMKHEVDQHFAGRLIYYIVRGALDLE